MLGTLELGCYYFGKIDTTTVQAAVLVDHINQCREHKENRYRNRKSEEEKFAAATLVKCCAEVVAPKSTTKTRSALL